MLNDVTEPLKIAIVGAGFSGTAFAAACHQHFKTPVQIFLYEKTGVFGPGEAYKTPFFYHLLNVKAKDMSAYEDYPDDFLQWLESYCKKMPEQIDQYLNENQIALKDQFVPRNLYGQYLKNLIVNMQSDTQSCVDLKLRSEEVIDVDFDQNQALVISKNQFGIRKQQAVDKIILALGNNMPSAFSFPILSDISIIHHPWDYEAPNQIDKNDSVCIVGTGLSMIDTVLTLYHQHHAGPIYAVSRHGLLPLTHSDSQASFSFPDEFLSRHHSLTNLTKALRKISEHYMEEGGDWRQVVMALRRHVPDIWLQASLADKKRFLRHLLPYWNIHRHRVPASVAKLLNSLSTQGQLKILAGRLQEAGQQKMTLRLRHHRHNSEFNTQWLINCMGPSLNLASQSLPLIQSLQKKSLATFDSLQLGLSVSDRGALKTKEGKDSSLLYTIGSLRKGHCWEVNAVPEIRQQCDALARHLT